MRQNKKSYFSSHTCLLVFLSILMSAFPSTPRISRRRTRFIPRSGGHVNKSVNKVSAADPLVTAAATGSSDIRYRQEGLTFLPGKHRRRPRPAAVSPRLGFRLCCPFVHPSIQLRERYLERFLWPRVLLHSFAELPNISTHQSGVSARWRDQRLSIWNV